MPTIPRQQALWERILAHRFDDPAARLTFTGRLARENGWPIGYAVRVVDEYRRFVFLALTAGHAVTPSEDVDQAWHLHLAYTRDYWQTFCRDVLREPLHHGPTGGGAAEADRYDHQYRRTLAAYAAAFDAPPPADIWPRPEQRFGPDLAWRRVNVARHWVIPKPRWLGGRPPLVAARFHLAEAGGQVVDLPDASAGGPHPPRVADPRPHEDVAARFHLAAAGSQVVDHPDASAGGTHPPRVADPRPHEDVAARFHLAEAGGQVVDLPDASAGGTHPPRVADPRPHLALALLPNPLDLTGPPFLMLFTALATASIVAGVILRRMFQPPGDPLATGQVLEPLELALLASDGRWRCAATGLASLAVPPESPTAQDGKIAPQAFALVSLPPRGSPPLLAALHARLAALGACTTVEAIKTAADVARDEFEPRLVDRGLMVGPWWTTAAPWVILAPVAATLVLGLAKIAVGTSRGKPVGFLVIGCVVLAAISLLALARRPRRTRKGDQILHAAWSRFRESGQEATWAKRRRAEAAAQPAALMPLAVALLGIGALGGTSHAFLQLPVENLRTGSNSGGGGCGTSGDGGGGGCGGCGGCGGGD